MDDLEQDEVDKFFKMYHDGDLIKFQAYLKKNSTMKNLFDAFIMSEEDDPEVKLNNPDDEGSPTKKRSDKPYYLDKKMVKSRLHGGGPGDKK